jgi:hypothetical protein
MLTKQAVVESFLDEGGVHARQVRASAEISVIHLSDSPKPLTRAAPIDFANAIDNVNAEQEKSKRPFHKLRTKFYRMFYEKEQNPFYDFQYDINSNLMQSLADLRAEPCLLPTLRRRRWPRKL